MSGIQKLIIPKARLISLYIRFYQTVFYFHGGIVLNIMSYYSDHKYGKRDSWYHSFQFERWFKGNKGPILDAGCSVGDFISIAPDLIEGIDIDSDALKKAQDSGFNVMKIDIDNGEMSRLEGNKYNGVAARQIIEHLYNPLQFVKEIRRILKSGGKAVILTPNCPYALNRAFWNDYTHKRPLTKASLNMLAHDAGFSDIKIYEDFRPMFGMGFLIRTFQISLNLISKIQRLFFIRGFSLVMELKK